MKPYIFSFVFFLNFYCLSAQYQLGFSALSRPEKRWVFFHPFVAKKAQVLTKKALQVVDTMKNDPRLDQHQNGGQIDAFRHTFWMATLAQQIKPSKVKKLGLAHEKANRIEFKKGRKEDGSYADQVSCSMDLYNNAIGIKIGTGNKNATTEELRQLVFIAVKTGECKIIKRNKAGVFLTCDGKPINTTENKNTWNIPKCLVNSNYDYE